MRRLARYSFLFAIILSAMPWGFKAPAQVLEQTFTDEDIGFKISTPDSHWSFAPRGTDPGAVRATLQYESGVHQFVPNAMVRVDDLPYPKMKLERLLKKNLEALPNTVELLQKKPLTREGRNGYEVLFRDKATNVVFHQWFFIAKGKSFVISCSAHADSYSRMERDFKKILASFQIL